MFDWIYVNIYCGLAQTSTGDGIVEFIQLLSSSTVTETIRL